MFHRKRFKLASVVVLALLLTIALAPVAVAQDAGDQGPPPTGTDDGEDEGNGDDTTPLPGNGNGDGTTPLPGNGNGNGDGTTPLPSNGNGNGNGDTMKPTNGDMMMGPPASWPPPNAIVRHAATPIQISSLEGGLQVYFIAADGAATNGPMLSTLSKLAEMHPSGVAVSLFSGTNPGTGKPVTIQYLPDAMMLHVNTFYADKPPHDYNKAYMFTVDADHSVNHERW